MANEKRLINAFDLVIKLAKKVGIMVRNGKPQAEIYRKVLECIADAPTVDAVEVVRCKDCESYDASGCYEGFGWCFLHDKGKMDNDYCSCGAKMDGDGNG